MSALGEITGRVQLPRMIRIRQNFDRPRVEDIPAEVRRQLTAEILSKVKPGMSVAVTGSSRGISNIATILKEVVSVIKEAGAEPFIFPAMGSHGGATPEGQREILAGFGITEENMGCPIRCTMEVTQIAAFEDNGRPVYIDKYAAEADGVILVGRVKAHTLFHDRVESGLCKMMAIGLGKQKGAEECHKEGVYNLGKNVQRYGYAILKNTNILFGLAIIENAYDETAILKAVRTEDIYDEEPQLLIKAKELMSRIMFDECDLMIVDEIGKNISGDGMDPNITGKYAVRGLEGKPGPKRMTILDLAEASHGSGHGMGFADTITKRFMSKFIPEKSYPNALTSQVPELSRIPMILDSDKECIQGALMTVFGLEDYTKAKVIRIKNTREVDELWISEALLDEAVANPMIEILGEPEEFDFDQDGNLF